MKEADRQELILLCAFPDVGVPMTKMLLKIRMERVAEKLFGDADIAQNQHSRRAYIDAVCKHYIVEDVASVSLVDNGLGQRAFMLDQWKDEYGAREIPCFGSDDREEPAESNVVSLFPARRPQVT